MGVGGLFIHLWGRFDGDVCFRPAGVAVMHPAAAIAFCIGLGLATGFALYHSPLFLAFAAGWLSCAGFIIIGVKLSMRRVG